MSEQYPSIGDQSKNVAKSVFTIFKGMMQGEGIFATQEVQAERRRICNGCEFNDKAEGKCVKCGCVLDWKIASAALECPEGKWGMDEEGFTQHVLKKLDKESENSQTTFVWVEDGTIAS